jgi:hypothetical protein
MKKRKWFVPRGKITVIAALGLLIYCWAVIGCAPTRIYSVNMNYDAQKAAIPAYMKAGDNERNTLIAVTEFVDARPGNDPLIIGRVVEKDGMKILVLPKYVQPTRAVASGIKDYLIKAGYKVDGKVVSWNLQERSIPPDRGKIIIGGSIEDMDLTCRKGFPTDSYRTKIKLNLVLADAAGGKILYRSSVESNSSLEHVSFSAERLEEQINIALGDAIEKLFEDRTVAQKLKEVINK